MILDPEGREVSREDLFNLNRNILVAGASGCGKTVFAKSLLDYYDGPVRFVAVKDGEGLDLSRNPPFLSSGKEAFIDAFLASLPDPNGFLTSQIGPVLVSIIDELPRASNWNVTLSDVYDKIKELQSGAERFEKPVYSFIQSRLNALYPSTGSTRPYNRVFDFRKQRVYNIYSLSSVQKPFFYEFVLRLIWYDSKPVDIWIDEFHHLGFLQNSIVGEMLREMRTRGGIVAITQNLSDVLPAYLGQFGRLFVGADVNPLDLSLYDVKGYADYVRLTHKYHFMDIRRLLENEVGGDYSVPSP